MTIEMLDVFDKEQDYLQEASFVFYADDPNHDALVGAVMRKVLYEAYTMYSCCSAQTKQGDMVTKMVIRSSELTETDD